MNWLELILVYFYAKNIYKKRDLLEDLKILASEYMNIDLDIITFSDILSILIEVAIEEIMLNSPNRRFARFLEDLRVHNWWRVNINTDGSLDLVLLRKCLEILRVSGIKNLGSPDTNLLPIREGNMEVSNKVR